MNIHNFVYNPIMILVIVYIIIAIVSICFIEKKGFKFEKIIGQALPFVYISMLPFAWYFCTINHSSIHNWFTYKILIVTAFAGLSMISQIYYYIKNQK